MKSISIVVLKEQLVSADLPLLYITLREVLLNTLKVKGKVSFETANGNKKDEGIILITMADNTQDITDPFFAKHVIKEALSSPFMITDVKSITVGN